VKVEEMSADGDAETLAAFMLKGTVGEMGEGEVGGRIVGFREPAVRGRGGWFCHEA
jgi:hypothetical protein